MGAVSDRVHPSPSLTPARPERRSSDMEIRNLRHHCHGMEAQDSVFLMKGQVAPLAVFGKKRANTVCFLNVNGLNILIRKSQRRRRMARGKLIVKCQHAK